MNKDSLTQFVEDVCIESHLRVQEDLGDGFVRLRSEEAERRQAAHDIRSSEDAVIEMLRNARDAHARNIFIATGKEGNARLITMIDDGDGIPEHLHQLVFEPRVTSKLDTMHMDKWGVHGRGMALYSIKVNAESAEVFRSRIKGGSSFKVRTDTRKLPERSDQSTFPQLSFNEKGNVVIKGPRNIIRTSCEFALEHRKSLNVYLGTPAEIAATLYARSMASASSALAFRQADSQTPLVELLAYSADALEFANTAHFLGLDMSERSAYRIIEGKIKPLDSLLESIEAMGISGQQAKSSSSKAKPKPQAHSLKLAISDEDLSAFSSEISHAFKDLASTYYLDPSVEPQFRVSSDGLHVFLPFVREDE